MVDKTSVGEQGEDFNRETLELSKDLERMTEQMENISGNINSKSEVGCLFLRSVVTVCHSLLPVNLTQMVYDMVVMRTDPQLAQSLQRLESALVQCKAVICGSTHSLADQCTAASLNTAQE